MVDTITTLGKSNGGGAPAYFSGKEVFHDLSAGNLALALTDMRKTHLLYSSADGKTVTLPAANTAGLVIGQGVGFRVLPKSKPIKILNAGTVGTDPILEAFLLPGADCAVFLQSVTAPSVTAGTWLGRGYGMFHGPVPVTFPSVQETGIDFGSVGLVASLVNGGTGLMADCNLIRLSSTQFVALGIPNAGTSVVAYPVSYTHATDTWTWGSGVTVFSTANQWSNPRAVVLSATTYAIMAFEATNNKVWARGGTIAANVITQGTAITSGAWGVNPTITGSMQTAGLVADSATTFFWISNYDGGTNNLAVTHFSIVGANLTQDGGATFAYASVNTGQFYISGSSIAANTVDIGYGNGASGFSRFTYAAGSVTNTYTRKQKRTSGTCGPLYLADATNRVYYTADGTGLLSRFVMNAGYTDMTEMQALGSPVLTNVNAPSTAFAQTDVLVISDDEMLVLGSFATVNVNRYSLTFINPALSLRARTQVVSGTSSDSGFANHVVAASGGYGPMLTQCLGAHLNTTNRRLAIMDSNVGQSLAFNRNIFMTMFDCPRNYDQATS